MSRVQDRSESAARTPEGETIDVQLEVVHEQAGKELPS
jgi:hypothetical protein